DRACRDQPLLNRRNSSTSPSMSALRLARPQFCTCFSRVNASSILLYPSRWTSSTGRLVRV
ncbi:MAG: hypothetical protein Q8M65_00995, partial [Rhodoglobus sp.]|nr:hypothetical protein [Rhodoglobus sp.]